MNAPKSRAFIDSIPRAAAAKMNAKVLGVERLRDDVRMVNQASVFWMRNEHENQFLFRGVGIGAFNFGAFWMR
jgi:hypothetical protein